MKKNYSIILSKENFDVLRKYLKEIKVIYEASGCGADVYITMNLDIQEYKIVSEWLEKNI